MKVNLPLSFKDPDGFIFYKDNQLFRQINSSYKENYNLLIKSGLYDELVKKKYLIPHKEIDSSKIIKPEPIPFISYPYEWSFSQLKDAALLTLEIMKIALKYNMILKDATSFNIQFLKGKPIFIDTLSFEKYTDGRPWVAYRQFCEQFLGPLALSVYTDIRLNHLLKSYLGSIPLDLAVKLLPLKARLNPSLLMHLFLHAKAQSGKISSKKNSPSLSKQALINIIDNLESTICNFSWKLPETLWKNYQDNNPSYSFESLRQKEETVTEFLKEIKPKFVWDLGSNRGEFSRLAAGMNANVVSMDYDPTVVEKNYLSSKEKKETNLLPLWIDLTNPTPALGWENSERSSLLSRPLPDTVLALALIHHLAIANNLPLPMLAEFFAGLCKNLVIEFIPKEDFQVKELLANREDIFPLYDQENFEEIFSQLFIIKKKKEIPRSKRVLYLMHVQN